jgi:hypothetical protein
MNLVMTFLTNDNRFSVTTYHKDDPLRGLFAPLVLSLDVSQFAYMVYLYILGGMAEFTLVG